MFIVSSTKETSFSEKNMNKLFFLQKKLLSQVATFIDKKIIFNKKYSFCCQYSNENVRA
jgi:hypothetical protein